MLISNDIVNIINSLWNLDNNSENDNIKFEYFNNQDYKNKYVMLMFLYILDNIENNTCYIVNKEQIRKHFNITNKNFVFKKCIESIKLLSELYIIYNNVKYELIKFDINNNKIIVGDWIKQIKIKNKIDIKLNYNIFIQGKNDSFECMSLPYILINNYYNGITTYKVRELFSDIFESNKIIRKRFIENIIEKINNILEFNDFYLEFDCDLSPIKFQLGICKIRNFDDIEEVILPINKLVKFDKNKNINKIVYFKEDEYFISNLGTLYRKSKPLVNTENLNGYIFNNLKDINGKQVCFLRHQIVAQIFLWDKYNKNMTVDHIDRNRHNNKLNNLRWATITEQINNRYNTKS